MPFLIFEISPSYTSQRCSECGYINKKNREESKYFKCIKCGFKTDPDAQAAYNIAYKWWDVNIFKDDLKESKESEKTIAQKKAA